MRTLVLLLALLGGSQVQGSSLPGGIADQEPRLATHTWTTRDGLPQNSINDIDQGADGVLWLATNGGVVRFDGSRFETFDVSSDPVLHTSRVGQVEVDPSGRVFAATASGDIIERYGPHWRPVELKGWQRCAVTGLESQADGSILIATLRGLYRVPAAAEQADLVMPGSFLACEVGPDESIFLSSPSETALLQGDKLEPVGPGGMTTLCMTPTGVLYMSGPHSAAALDEEGLHPLEVDGSAPVLLGLDAAGRPWFAAEDHTGWWDRGRGRIRDQPQVLELLDGSLASSIFTDSAGRTWIGSRRCGLLCLSSSPLWGESLEPAAGYSETLARDASGHIYSIEAGLQELAPQGPRAVPGVPVTRIASSSQGSIWVLGSRGLGRLVGGKLQVELPPSQIPRTDGCMLETRDGSLLLTSHDGLFRWDGLELVKLDLHGADISSLRAALFERKDGTLVLGGSGGLLLWSEESAVQLHSGQDLPPGQVRSFAETGDGHLWIGTYGGGLASLDGDKLTVIDRGRGLFENTASALVVLGDQLVVIGNRSVSSYPIETLNAAIRDPSALVRGRSFDSGPGLDFFESNCILQPRVVQDDRGRIWIPALRGVSVFDPKMIPEREPAPIVRVLSSGDDLERVSHAPDGAVTLVPRHPNRGIQLRFSAASFAQPRQIHYRYRLVGQDPTWITALDEDATLTYSGLAPGEYHFEIQAAVADGEYGPLNGDYSIEVPYLWYERPWVRLGTVLAALIFVSGIGLFRIKSIRQRNQLLEARVRERTLELESENQERRRVEDDLRKASEELEDKVALRTSELARALANLEWDMRRREKLEGRLRESEKLEAVGRLAGGLAHDFNNILTAILGEADLAQADLEVCVDLTQLREDLSEHLGNVRDAGMRAARLTRQLLAYSRQQVMQPEVVDPLETLQELQTMLERLVPDNVSIEIARESEHSRVLIDPGQLEQVVVNLVVNAAEAMPEGGEVLLGSRVEGHKAIIEVTDSGIGLAAVDLERIFEPFFSTKGKARGLGLASVHGIVLQSGGSLDVKSEPGAGTTFHVSLPITTERPADELTPLPRPPAGGLRILLVDDEEDVRRVAKKMLERKGHRVLDSGDPKTALELAKRHAGELDLLVTDVVMPHMNGKQLSQAVQAEVPGIRVLYISGYSTEILSDREQLESGANLLTKPFDSEALAARIAELV